MKHVFCIHSNITYLAALGVVCRENLPLADVVIVSNNNYERDTPVKVHQIRSYGGWYNWHNIWRHPINSICTVRYIDNEIKRLVGNETYIAYTEALFAFHDVIVTHPLCQQFHFIEEGLSVYYKEMDWQQQTANYSCQPCYRYKGWRGFFQKLKDISLLLRGYKLEMLGLPALYNAFFNAKDMKFYGFSDESYYGVNNLCRISLEQVRTNFEWHTHYEKLEDIDIWLGQNNPRGGNELIDKYVDAIEKGCAQQLLKQGKRHILVKFHPVEETYAKKQTIKMFQHNGIEVEIIPNEVVLELELFKAKNVRLYSISSSLLLYASMLGVECNSIINHMPSEFKVNTPALWKRVNFV